MNRPSFFAVLGDVHGHFDKAILALQGALDTVPGAAESLSAVFCVGDVEALRSEAEIHEVHGPAKYRTMGEFHCVLTGELTFPAPVYFIGGNHEPWASLDADGGLVSGHGQWAPGVSFLGRAGVLEVVGLRVAFLSGIYSPVGSARTVKQRLVPVSDRKRRTYWVEEELRTVLAAGSRRPVDVLLTHDWPAGIGADRMGAPTGDVHVRSLVEKLRPTISCHGHMHHPLTAQIGPTSVHCLGHIRAGADAVALFSVSPGQGVTRIY